MCMNLVLAYSERFHLKNHNELGRIGLNLAHHHHQLSDLVSLTIAVV